MKDILQNRNLIQLLIDNVARAIAKKMMFSSNENHKANKVSNGLIKFTNLFHTFHTKTKTVKTVTLNFTKNIYSTSIVQI